MAYDPVTVEQLESIQSTLAQAASRLKAICDDMKSSNLLTAMLQITSLKKFATSCKNLVADAELHVENQKECRTTGDLPIWRQNTDRGRNNRIRDLKREAENLLVQIKAAAPGSLQSLTLNQVVRILEMALAKHKSQKIVDLVKEIRESGLDETIDSMVIDAGESLKSQGFVKKSATAKKPAPRKKG